LIVELHESCFVVIRHVATHEQLESLS